MTREPEPCYLFGPFRLEIGERRLTRDGCPVPLTPKVFDLLRLLVQDCGRLQSKERLLHELWPDTFVEEANLTRAVFTLRKALGERWPERRYIETVSKNGYRFVAPVTAVCPGSAGTPADAAGAIERPPLGLRIRWRLALVAAGSAIAVGAVAVFVLGPRSQPRPPTQAAVHRQLTFSGRDGGGPALSHDGRSVVYVSHESQHRTLQIAGIDEGRPVAVFEAPEVGRPRWSPDDSSLLLWARGAGHDGIYVIPRRGGVPRLVAPRQFVACWSPDGSAIAVALYLSSRIMFVDPRDGRSRSVTLSGVHRWIGDMDWSPITNRLVLISSDDDGRSSIWTMRPDGRDQRLVLRQPAEMEIVSARWAPGRSAIYFFHRVNQTMSLSKIAIGQAGEAHGAALPLLTGLEADGPFALSTDARALVYARSFSYSNLWSVQRIASGHSVRTVTKELTRGTSIVERPRVSPDGAWIAFNRGRGSLSDIYVMAISGGAPRRITSLDALSINPVWSPDGRTIAFASTVGAKPRVWIASVEGGAARPVSLGDLSADTLELAWAPGQDILYQQAGNRNFIALAPQTGRERPLIRDTSVGWIFTPIHAPSGTSIAVAWNRRPVQGVWIVDEEDAHERPLSTSGPPALIGWSRNGGSIYVLEGGRPIYRGVMAARGETLTDARLVTLSAHDGALQSRLDLPFDEVGGVSMTPDGSVVVCAVYVSQSDVWIIDRFDPNPLDR